MASRPPYRDETINNYLERGFQVDWGYSGLPSDLGGAPGETAYVTFIGRHLETEPDILPVFNIDPTTYERMEQQLRYGDRERLQ